jgi:hypothetical protein
MFVFLFIWSSVWLGCVTVYFLVWSTTRKHDSLLFTSSDKHHNEWELGNCNTLNLVVVGVVVFLHQLHEQTKQDFHSLRTEFIVLTQATCIQIIKWIHISSHISYASINHIQTLHCGTFSTLKFSIFKFQFVWQKWKKTSSNDDVIIINDNSLMCMTSYWKQISCFIIRNSCPTQVIYKRKKRNSQLTQRSKNVWFVLIWSLK